jgi:flagellar motor switch protein FliN
MTENEDIAHFLSEWAEEFTRAVEMSSGVRPVVRCNTAAKLEESFETLAKYLWWRQVFEGASNFETWIGTDEGTLEALAGAQGAESSDARGTYLEIIGQAQQATASLLSSGMPKPFQCRQGVIASIPELDELLVSKVEITLGEKVLTPLVLGIGTEYMPIVAPVKQQTSLARLPAPEASSSMAPMLDRLLDLELPLSVALGRSIMPIKDVLKVAPGSLIELDRNVGDYVDLVVHGKIVARGEVVSVRGNYGVRVKEIISRDDRLTLYGGS